MRGKDGVRRVSLALVELGGVPVRIFAAKARTSFPGVIVSLLLVGITARTDARCSTVVGPFLEEGAAEMKALEGIVGSLTQFGFKLGEIETGLDLELRHFHFCLDIQDLRAAQGSFVGVEKAVTVRQGFS